MSEPAPPPAGGTPSSPAAADRLDSWKDIAAYLRRDVSTVQRWEKREGMPVHRHQHDKLGSIYAFRAELDAWSRARRRSPEEEGPGAPAAPPSPAGQVAPPPGAEAPAPRPIPVRPRARWLAPGAALALLAAGLAAWGPWRPDPAWRNPLADARFQRVTDFEGSEEAAVLSRDGSLIAFLADRDGPVDLWVTQVGSGQFHNLTHGAVAELRNPSVRTLAFSPDGARVVFWVSGRDGIGLWTIPTLGGAARPYLPGVAELDWSADGARLAFHTPGAGDPMFVRDHEGAPDRPLFQAAPGRHAHFPVWSPDGASVVFVQGVPPGDLDLWRVPSAGGTPERLTSHHARVSHPVFLDRRTLLYLATTPDGTRTGLWAVDVERPSPRPLGLGAEHYTSLAGSAGGRRLVATVASPRETLWRVPLGAAPAAAAQATRIALPTASARSPRFLGGDLLYVATRGGRTSLWRVGVEPAAELWSAAGARLLGGPAVAPGGRRIAFAVEEQGRTRLEVIDEHGARVRTLGEGLGVQGPPAWAPDGASLTVAAAGGDGVPRLVGVSLQDGAVTTLAPGPAADPAWAPDGRLVAYSGPEVGTTFSLKAAGPDGGPAALPPLTLPRGARRVAFLAGGRSLVVLRGEVERKDLWRVDLDTGAEERLTDLGPDFSIRDFDVSPDGRELVFDRLQENSDLVLIERP